MPMAYSYLGGFRGHAPLGEKFSEITDELQQLRWLTIQKRHGYYVKPTNLSNH